jgi:peptidoglycan L-alanyl-D-glutamate endopeptidase CwlK
MSEHIKAVQQALGVKADGMIGPVTRAALIRAAEQGRVTIAPAKPAFIKYPDDQATRDNGGAKLVGVHADLVRLVIKSMEASPVPFVVIEGLRTLARQKQLVEQGASKTMNSRHLTGHAVDLWPVDPATGKAMPGGKENEERLWVNLRRIAKHVKAVAAELGTPIEWGGDWGWDAPHFQLPRSAYPM